MLKSLQYRRLLWLSLLVVLAYCGLGWRLVELQVFSAAKARQAYEQGSVRESIELPKRGDIRDRNGATLTTSIQRYNICAEPLHVFPLQDRVAAALAGPLGMDARQLAILLTPQTNISDRGEQTVKAVVMLKRDASFEQWAAVREIMRKSDFGLNPKKLSRSEQLQLLGLRRFGVRLDSQYQTRQYPNGALAGQILGYVGNTNRELSIGDPFIDQMGLAGIERAWNLQLAGVPGFRRVYRNEPTDQTDEYLPAVDGLNVILTVDRRIQEILDHELATAFEELRPKAVLGTVMNVNTGEILATSAAPLFNPGNRERFDPQTVRLRPILDEFEPGSIFKVIAISGALNDRVVDLNTPIDCMNGLMPVSGMAPLTDHDGGFGVLSVKGIVTHSSNIGTAQVVRRLGYDRFYHWLLEYGIGTRTGVGLREGSGQLRPRKAIYPGEFTRLPIGYGVQVTQLQLASTYSAIANGGKLMQPRLVARLEDRQGKVVVDYRPEVVRRVITEETSREMIEALRTVTEPGGTAVEAAMDHYVVAGKTGTAHKFNASIGRYDLEHYYASFIGFLPATHPEICIAITVDEPYVGEGRSHFGGKVAGPIFKRVAEQAAFHLHLKPDRDPGNGESKDKGSNQVSADGNQAGPGPTATAALVQPPARPSAPTAFRISSNLGE